MLNTTLLITDTNIWIDLDHGDLIDHVFRLPYKICSADVAREEIQSIDPHELEKRGLLFLSLDPILVHELTKLRIERPKIAVADMAGFILAREKETILLTGDKNLRDLALENHILVHGLLWLMDEMVSLGILQKVEAIIQLRKILDKGSRLPKDECEKRFREWDA